MRSAGRTQTQRAAIPGEGKMAEGSGKLKGLREQMVAAAQALAEERRSQSGTSPVPAASTVTAKTTKPVIDGSALRTDERQRLARERREEREKLNAAKESQLIEKEKKAKLQYEKQIEEKLKKLEEQRQKDEQKRTAVEEKRKQKLLEEKERREANVRRTLERSSQLEQRQKRWSWGGSVPDVDNKQGNKRSTSTTNLKQGDGVINKRLSSSSAALQSSSEKAHRPLTNPLDSSIISRLLAPTQSSLARSKSAVTLPSDGKESPASAATISTPPSVPKGPIRSRSIDRLKSPRSASSSAGSPDLSQKSETEKQTPPSLAKRPPSPALLNSRRRSPSPANTTKRAPSPTLENKKIQKNSSPTTTTLKQRASSPTVTHKPVPIQRPSLTPGVLSTTKKGTEPDAKPKEKMPEGVVSESKTAHTSEKETTAPITKTKDDPSSKAITGSTTAEEAAKMLAEKRRLAREQREREEQERIHRQQEEKVRQEEMARRAEEERARQKEEEEKLKEKRRLEQEVEQKLAEEERIRKELEEQERLAELQQQKEEAEAKALEEAEKQRQERDKIMQQNMQERLERKKRIEEIMKRTRKTEQMDARNENTSEQGAEDDEDMISLDSNLHGSVNGIDLCDEVEDPGEESSDVPPCLTTPEPLNTDASFLERNKLFINGDKPDIEQKQNGQPLENAPPEEISLVTDDTALPSQDHLQFEYSETRELVQNLNGKSSTWTFEEFIDLGIHSKSTSLSPESISIDGCNQNLIEDAISPAAPKLAFEEGKMNALSSPIESAAEM
ncbi:LOW QUALITY PROTEIN: MAP7 domain-containing protein 3 [Rhinophrynus dorsalis]